MKKDVIFLLIAVVVLLSFILPKPAGTIVALVTLIPAAIYLIIDIFRNGNKWRKN
ncbi:MAG: hypothetical protein Q4D16_14325 [Eubacteriales bacterium]|nr:hypothetical protein [Eubacteriales bacterium]